MEVCGDAVARHVSYLVVVVVVVVVAAAPPTCHVGTCGVQSACV